MDGWMDGWLDRLMIATTTTTTTIANIYRHESLATLKNLLAKVEKNKRQNKKKMEKSSKEKWCFMPRGTRYEHLEDMLRYCDYHHCLRIPCTIYAGERNR